MKPLFNWLKTRSTGVLLHPTAFPGEHGIGTLGQEARAFLDFLHGAGIRYWQICPLGPTGYGDSPYQSFSALAGNPYLIDLPELVAAGLLSDEDLGPLRSLPATAVDYGAIYQLKRPILRLAFEAWRRGKVTDLPYGDYAQFKADQAAWLEPFAYFQALKDHFKGESFLNWPKACATFSSAGQSRLRTDRAVEIESHRFYQYLFFGQWTALRTYASRRGVGIIGDLPIFVAPDSADLWAHPDLFRLDTKRRVLTNLAGCPPDYFSADGQLWGNPLFDWGAMKADGYAWWHSRLASNFALFDVVRLDHFRGFDTYWSIPEGATTAIKGEWLEGPGLDFFSSIHRRFPDARIIAEDLGELAPTVIRLRERTGLPGMAILQFAFGGGSDNFYLPHNLRRNMILYPGTHDNNTTLGWYEQAPDRIRDHVRRHLRVDGHEIAWDFVRAAYQSVCSLVVLPLQDLLSLGSEARFNTPGQAAGNWSWRYSTGQLDRLREDSTGYLRELAELYGREPEAPKIRP